MISDSIPVEIHHDLLSVCRDGCSVIPSPSCDKSLPIHPSIYLTLCWLKPHIPNRGDPSGPSACVSLPLTSGPSLSAPDLSTFVRGSQQHASRRRGREQRVRARREMRQKGRRNRGEKGGGKGKRATEQDRLRKEWKMERIGVR